MPNDHRWMPACRRLPRLVARAPLGGAQAALVAMRRDGEVVNMVGGGIMPLALQPRHSGEAAGGSTFKLFVYLAALEAGAQPGDVISNLPIETVPTKNAGWRGGTGTGLPPPAMSPPFACSNRWERMSSKWPAPSGSRPDGPGRSQPCTGHGQYSPDRSHAAMRALRSFPVEPTAFNRNRAGGTGSGMGRKAGFRRSRGHRDDAA